MKLHELRQFTGESIRKRPKMVWRMALLYPAVWLLMKLIPDSMAFFMLLKTPVTPEGVFFGRNPFWILFSVLWNVLRFCVLTPVLCMVCSWFSEHLGLGGSHQNFFRNHRLFWKSLRFFGMTEIIRFLMLFPFVISCMLTAYAFEKSTLTDEAGFWLFLMIQGIAAAFWTGLYYVRFCVNLSVMPFLFLENPERSAWRAVLESADMLEHQYGKLLLIVITGVLPSSTVTMLMLFLQIRIREYAQEKETYGRLATVSSLRKEGNL